MQNHDQHEAAAAEVAAAEAAGFSNDFPIPEGALPGFEEDAQPMELVREASQFEVTATINAIAGNEHNNGWPAIDLQRPIIESEFKELMDAITNRDVKELRDGICDVIFTVLGLAHRAGLPYDRDYHAVVVSNMTKFDENEEDAARTAEKYNQLGVVTNCHIVTDRMGAIRHFVTKSAHDQTDNRGKFVPGGKWLKSYRFEEPVFEELDPLVTFTLEQTKNGKSLAEQEAETHDDRSLDEKIRELQTPEAVERAKLVSQAIARRGIEGVTVDPIYEEVDVEELADRMVSNLLKIQIRADEMANTSLPQRVANGLGTKGGYPSVEVAVGDGIDLSAEELVELAYERIQQVVVLEGSKLEVSNVTVCINAADNIDFEVSGTDEHGIPVTLDGKALANGQFAVLSQEAANDDQAH